MRRYQGDSEPSGIQVATAVMMALRDATNILETKVCELTEEEKVPLIKNLLGEEGLQLIQTFTREEKNAYVWRDCLQYYAVSLSHSIIGL